MSDLCEHGFDPDVCLRCAQEGPHEGYGLVMPFVTVQSVGGPHEDHSYVQGWAMCALEFALAADPDKHETYTHPSNVAQADLLAMKHGYEMTSEPWEQHPDEHTLLTFTKPAKPSGPQNSAQPNAGGRPS